MNADGSGQVNLTNNPASDQRPMWSADGSQIAFHTDRDGNAEVYVMKADGSNSVNNTRNPATDKQPIWSPDGSRIAFNSDRGGALTTHVMGADGSDAKMVGGGRNDWATDWTVVGLGAAPSASPVPLVQPTAAAATAPQPAAQPSAVTLASLPYSDDFSDPNSGWPAGATESSVKEYRDGEFSLKLLGDTTGAWSILPDRQFADFTMEVDIRRVGDVEGDIAGFIFGYVDSDHYSDVGLSRQGTYRIRKKVNGKLSNIWGWSKASAIQLGQATNHLKVTRQGDQIAVFVNDQHLTTVRDQSLKEGRIGLVVWPLKDKPNAQAAFDNFKLTTAEDVPPPLFAPLPLVDDFSDPNSGWPEESDDKRVLGYRDGEYHIHIPGDSRRTSGSLPDARWGDFTAEVDIRQVSDVEDDAGGLVLRRVDSNNFYEVSISPRGYHRVRKMVGGTFSIIQPWTKSAAVLLGQATNRLKVICKGDQMAVFVNGQHVTTVRDKAVMQGQVGLRAEAFEGKPNAHVAFDNFTLSAAGDVPPHPQGQLPLADDFSDPNSGWPTLDNEYAVRGYRDDSYHYLKRSGTRSWSLLPDRMFADFALEVDATKIGGPEGGEYGVVLRSLGNNDYYMFQVSPDGTISVQKKVGGEYTELVPWQVSSAVSTGQATNRLKVVCQDTDCAVYVNDQQVAAFADDTFLQGQVGFVVGHSHNAEGTEVTFDNLRVSAP